jgi:hypothetical protein
MKRVLILAAAVLVTGILGGAVQAAPLPPPGNYAQTCRNIDISGGGRSAAMTAECRDRDGRWRSSTLLFDGCDRIENRDGVLSCLPARGYIPPGGPGSRPGDAYPPPGPGQRPGDAYPPPGPGLRPGDAYSPPPPNYAGRGRPALTLFSAPDFGGRPFTTQGEITNLPKQDNDRAMSLKIDGRSAWMVCSDSDFRGRCQVFDHDVRDLRQFGLGGQISSMRPIR